MGKPTLTVSTDLTLSHVGLIEIIDGIGMMCTVRYYYGTITVQVFVARTLACLLYIHRLRFYCMNHGL